MGDKSARVERFQRATVYGAMQIMASMGVHDPTELRPHMLRTRVAPFTVRSHAKLYEWLAPGQLLTEPPATWAEDWAAANPGQFTV
ncbi:hypothetical protein GCM10009578_051340 [Streptomyces rhizosphaericus]